MKTQVLKANNLKPASLALLSGEVVAFPTETVFGLGVIFDDEKAYQKLVAIKERPPTQPFTLMCASTLEIEKYAELSVEAKKIVKTFMPGPLTIIVKVKADVPSFVTLGTGYIGIRVSESKLVQDLIRLTGKPLLVPSANKHGVNPCLSSESVYEAFNGELPYIIEGASISNIPSTIIKINDKIELIRTGSIPFTKILETVR